MCCPQGVNKVHSLGSSRKVKSCFIGGDILEHPEKGEPEAKSALKVPVEEMSWPDLQVQVLLFAPVVQDSTELSLVVVEDVEQP